MSSQGHPRSSQQPQPTGFKPSLKALLSLPYRLCNPPAPSVGKVRSCSVTPVYNVQLDDILNRTHLPPLGLKDFEEWLVFIEHSPENLYFILWLKEYTERYNRWVLQSGSSQSGPGEYRLKLPTPGSSSLSMFYARAKQTFFTPNADYELDIPSDILSPFYKSNLASPHPPPHPAAFTQVATEVKKMLRESLDRFVIAAYTNVGNTRGLCGIVGGIVVALLGSIPPIIVSILTGRSRWPRLWALPGLWMGLTVLITSLHGVCLMVYVMGDLRQLRKFELARPRISRPKLIMHSRQLSAPASSALVQTPITRPPLLSVPQSRRPSIQPPAPPPLPVHEHPAITTVSSHGTESVCSESCCSDDSCYSAEPSARPEIHISDAYYDEQPAAEGPATNPISIDYTFPMKDQDASRPDTATFIHSYDPASDDDDYDHSSGGITPSPEELQPMSAFDFDALPIRRRVTPAPRSRPRKDLVTALNDRPLPRSHLLLSPMTLLVRAQDKCTKSSAASSFIDMENPWPHEPPPPPPPHNNHPKDPSPPHRDHDHTKSKVRTQLRLARAVPAFASPLTRVLSPVVTRAQWEIVMRSALLGLLLSWGILGGILAIPTK